MSDKPATRFTLGKLMGLGSLIVLVFMVAVPISFHFLFDKTNWGTYGDMFGVANALFSGLGFVSVCAALYLQHRELKESHEMLREQISTRAHPLLVADTKALLLDREEDGTFSAGFDLVLKNCGADPAVHGKVTASLSRTSGDSPQPVELTLPVALESGAEHTHKFGITWKRVDLLDGFVLNAQAGRSYSLAVNVSFDSAFGGQFEAKHEFELTIPTEGSMQVAEWQTAGQLQDNPSTVALTVSSSSVKFEFRRRD